MKEFLTWYHEEFSKLNFFCLTHLRKDQMESWEFVFNNILKIDPSISNVVLFDNEEKNRIAFLNYLYSVRSHALR